MGLIPWSGRFPGVGNGNPHKCSCLENRMDRGPWRLQSTWSQVAKSRKRLSMHEYCQCFTARKMKS